MALPKKLFMRKAMETMNILLRSISISPRNPSWQEVVDFSNAADISF